MKTTKKGIEKKKKKWGMEETEKFENFWKLSILMTW